MINARTLRLNFMRFFSHGFINGNANSEVNLDVLRRREQKWLDMMKNWDKYMVNQYKKVRSRCRKGIPPATRPEAWSYLCGAKYLMDETETDSDTNPSQNKFQLLCVSLSKLYI